MFRKATWGIEDEKKLLSQLRSLKRLELLNQKRVAASTREKYVGGTFNPPSLDQLPLLIDQLHSEVNKEVVDALHGLKKIFYYQPPPVDLVLQHDILPVLSHLLDNQSNKIIVNLVATIVASLSTTENTQSIQQMIDIGIPCKLANVVKGRYSIAYANIFEQSYTALANIMATNDKCRDVCISYGFVPQFFNLCAQFLANYDTSKVVDQTLPEALCHMLSALTSGKTCCSIEIAEQIVPYVFKMGKGFEGDSSIHILTTLINLSKFGKDYIQLLVSDAGLIDFLQGIINMKYCDYQIYVMNFIWNCTEAFPQTLDIVFPLVEPIYDVLSQASNGVYHYFCQFLKLYMQNQNYSMKCLEYVRKYMKTIAGLVSNLCNNCSDTVFDVIEMLMILIKLYQDKDLFVKICAKGLVEYGLTALQKQFILEKKQYVRQLLEMIYMALKLEESGEVRPVEMMVEENEDEMTNDQKEDYNKMFLQNPPSNRFSANNGFAVLDSLLVECKEFATEINAVKHQVENMLNMNDDSMAL